MYRRQAPLEIEGVGQSVYFLRESMHLSAVFVVLFISPIERRAALQFCPVGLEEGFVYAYAWVCDSNPPPPPCICLTYVVLCFHSGVYRGGQDAYGVRNGIHHGT